MRIDVVHFVYLNNLNRRIILLYRLRLLLLHKYSLGERGDDIATETGSQNGVQERVGARIDGIHEDEQYFRFGDVDQRIAEQCGVPEEYHRSGACKIRADQYKYLAHDRRLAGGRVPRVVAQRRVDLHVAEQHQQERAGRKGQ